MPQSQTRCRLWVLLVNTTNHRLLTTTAPRATTMRRRVTSSSCSRKSRRLLDHAASPWPVWLRCLWSKDAPVTATCKAG